MSGDIDVTECEEVDDCDLVEGCAGLVLDSFGLEGANGDEETTRTDLCFRSTGQATTCAYVLLEGKGGDGMSSVMGAVSGSGYLVRDKASALVLDLPGL